MSEDRSADDPQLVSAGVEHRMSRDIGWHHVRRELDAGVGERQRLRERAHQQGLSEARHALEQYVAGRDQCDDDLIDHGSLTDHGMADLLPQPGQQLGGAHDGTHFCLHGQDPFR